MANPSTANEGKSSTSEVGDTGIEPVTSSMSRKRANPCANRPVGVVKLWDCEVETGFEPVYTALQAVASPLGHSTLKA